MNIAYLLGSGKNPKWLYYLRNYIYYYAPKFFARRGIEAKREKLLQRSDYEYILSRVNYYNAMAEGELPQSLPTLSEHRPDKQKVYFFDSYRYTSLFPQTYRWSFLPGDIVHVPSIPTILKSRPLYVDNTNSVLLKLDKVRHFTFVHDTKPWRDKQSRAIFRGKVQSKDCRVRFMEMYYDHPLVDAGDVGRSAHKQWLREKKTIAEHLDYKFVLALEGNDVASNLKWIMSSNCLAIMPKPSCETWFMEGTLIAGIHYVEIKPDLSDLIEQMEYYIAHPEKAEAIIRNANAYVAQFMDEEREDLISYLVLERYFQRSKQRSTTG